MAESQFIDFIIIGAQKGGTTAAAYNLNKHPDISVFSGITEFRQYEIEFFNQHWECGIEWYREQVPKFGIRGEKTAELLHRTICHERIFQTAPQVKLVVLLRNPVERAYSQWKMAHYNKKDEQLTFEEVINSEINQLNNQVYIEEFYQLKENQKSCWREGYLLKGFYSDQLQSLFRFFPKEQIYIGISERIGKDKENGYNDIFAFLHARPYRDQFEDRFVGKTAAPMISKIERQLKEIYSKPNENLFNLLGYEIEEWKND